MTSTPVPFATLARDRGLGVQLPRLVLRLLSATVWLQVTLRRRRIRAKSVFGTSLMNNEVSTVVYEDFLPQALADGRYVAAPEPAALELFVEQGFAETTVPQITARAGLTTRTFFRHFADKREVLFAGEEELPALVAGLMADAPASLGPMMLIEQGLEAVAATRFEGRLDYLRARRGVVQGGVSVSRWLDHDAEQPLTELLHETLCALQSVIADPDQQPHDASPRMTKLRTSQ